MRRDRRPGASGVLSALGLAVSERRRDLVESVLLAGDALTREAVARGGRRLGERGREELGAPEAELRATYELRYAGQAFELPIDGRARAASRRSCVPPSTVPTRSATAMRTTMRELELVTVRVAAALPGAEPPSRARRAGRARAARAPRASTASGGDADGARPRRARRWRARRSSSCPARRWSCRRAGARAADADGGGDGAAGEPRRDRAPGDARRAARRLRRDGRRAGALGPLGQHQGAPRRLDRAVRRRGPDGDAGRAHPGAPRRDAGGGGGRAATRTTRPATPGSSTTRSAAGPTCPTSR